MTFLSCSRLASLACLALSIAAASHCTAQSSQTGDLQRRIHDQLAVLREHPPATNHELGYQWALLGMAYTEADEFANAENAYNRALEALSKDPADESLYAETLDQFGALYRMYERTAEAANLYRRALVLRQKTNDPIEIARSQSRLAEIALASHKYKEALTEANGAYAMMVRLNDPAKVELISTLIERSYAQCGLRRHKECLSDAQEALALSRSSFGGDSQPGGAALVALGAAQLKAGEAEQAEVSTQEGLRILREQLVAGDPRITFVMLQYRDCLQAMHRNDKAQEIATQLSAINRQSARACPGCTVSAWGLRSPVH